MHKFKDVKEFKNANGGCLGDEALSLDVELIDKIAKATIAEAKEIMKSKFAKQTVVIIIKKNLIPILEMSPV